MSLLCTYAVFCDHYTNNAATSHACVLLLAETDNVEGHQLEIVCMELGKFVVSSLNGSLLWDGWQTNSILTPNI